jgi:hypothetical protein
MHEAGVAVVMRINASPPAMWALSPHSPWYVALLEGSARRTRLRDRALAAGRQDGERRALRRFLRRQRAVGKCRSRRLSTIAATGDGTSCRTRR